MLIYCFIPQAPYNDTCEICRLDDHAKFDAESMRKLFEPPTGALYVYRHSKRRRVFSTELLIGLKKVTCLATNTPYLISVISTISQTGGILLAFLFFSQWLDRVTVEDICRKDIAAYVEHMHDRGLEMTSINKLPAHHYPVCEGWPVIASLKNTLPSWLTWSHTGVKIKKHM